MERASENYSMFCKVKNHRKLVIRKRMLDSRLIHGE